MSLTDWDTIILGQGLAGSLLAWNLIQQGQRVLIADQARELSASRIAAGLINPVTGKRLVKHKKTDSFLNAALLQYAQLKEVFGTPFFHAKPMTRLFRSEEDHTAYEKRMADPDYRNYLGHDFKPLNDLQINNPRGGFYQYQTGYLDTVTLLDALKNYFIKNDCFLEIDIEYDEIKIEPDAVILQTHQSEQLIFCEGYQATANPWFNWLPFKLAKGEILTLDTKSRLPENIINAGHWLLPTDTHRCKFGATYQWHELNEKTTAKARSELLAAINKLFKTNMDFTVAQQHAGIRPCTKDTSPYIGLHPEYPRIGIFNGFGSRGSLTIPYYAQHYCEHLIRNQPLEPDININRHWTCNG